MEKEYNFKFNESEVNIILSGLGELPSKLSYNLINKIYSIHNAVQEQNNKTNLEIVKDKNKSKE